MTYLNAVPAVQLAFHLSLYLFRSVTGIEHLGTSSSPSRIFPVSFYIVSIVSCSYLFRLVCIAGHAIIAALWIATKIATTYSIAELQSTARQSRRAALTSFDSTALFNSRVLGFRSRREGTRLHQPPLPIAQSRSPPFASRHSGFKKLVGSADAFPLLRSHHATHACSTWTDRGLC